MSEHQTLRPYSWNVFVYNKEPQQALRYISTLDFDILCLQEVSTELLVQLRELPYHLVSGVDTRFVTDAWHPERGETQAHVIILSKHPIERYGTAPYAPLPLQDKWRTRVFHLALRFAGLWKGGHHYGREMLWADIRTPIHSLRVICAHLSVITPQLRQDELAVVREYMTTDRPTIIAGDLNIIEHWAWKWWNWLQGGHLRDALPWTSERKCVERQLAEMGMKNPFCGTVTCPLVRSQLDHILVPMTAEVLEQEISPDRSGSDHCPIHLSIRLTAGTK